MVPHYSLIWISLTHSSILAWRIPWTGEPDGLQSVGLQRVRHDWATDTHTHTHNTYTHTKISDVEHLFMCFLAICILKTLSLRVVCYISINDQNSCVWRAASLHIPLALFAYALASFCSILRHFRNCEIPTFALVSTLFLNQQLQKVGSATGYWARTCTDYLLTLIKFLHISEVVKIRLLMSPSKRVSKRWLIRHLVHFLARVKHPVSGVYQRLEDRPGDNAYLSSLPY